MTSVRSSPRDLSRPFFLPSLLPSPSLPRTVLRNEFNAIELANQFVASPDEAKSGKWSTTISVTYDTSDPEKYNKLVGWLETQVNDLIRESSVENDVDNGACGVAPFATAILDGVKRALFDKEEATSTSKSQRVAAHSHIALYSVANQRRN